MVSIWHNDEIPGYLKGKGETSYTKWRVLVMERCAQLTGLGEQDAAQRIVNYGMAPLGIAYDDGMTAESLAQELAR